jgi:DNA polymerase I-like protein with 3'-5' exonuclease and polymerase domains
VPDPGCCFIGWDLEQAEARIVAFLTHDDDLIQDMEDGIDIHRKLAAQLPFGVTYEQLLQMSKDCRERVLAKKCRHALNYQMGPLTFKASVNKDYIESGIGITAAEAKVLRNRYLSIHHNLPQWWREVEGELSKNGSLKNPLGRVRRFFGAWGGELFRDATAFVPQSTVGDLTTMGIAGVDQELGYHGKEIAIPLIHMHDGGLIQVPEEAADEVAEGVKRIMSIPINIAGYSGVVIPVEVFKGYNWGYASKTNPNGLAKLKI